MQSHPDGQSDAFVHCFVQKPYFLPSFSYVRHLPSEHSLLVVQSSPIDFEPLEPPDDELVEELDDDVLDDEPPDEVDPDELEEPDVHGSPACGRRENPSSPPPSSPPPSSLPLLLVEPPLLLVDPPVLDDELLDVPSGVPELLLLEVAPPEPAGQFPFVLELVPPPVPDELQAAVMMAIAAA